MSKEGKRMVNVILVFLATATLATPAWAAAEKQQTVRKDYYSSSRYHVWQTTIYPGHARALKMHRHDYDRMVFVNQGGTLKIVTNDGKSRLLPLKEGEVYFFPKDLPNELHSDENVSKKPIKVVVTEILSTKGRSTSATANLRTRIITTLEKVASKPAS
jgi:mannose-6-phosphate isomerase-like protein (cupin superfamily)